MKIMAIILFLILSINAQSNSFRAFGDESIDDKLINDWKKLEIKNGEGFHEGEKIIFLDYDFEAR